MNRLPKFLRRSAAIHFSLIALAAAHAAPKLGPWVPMFQGIDHLRATNSISSTDFDNLMVANAIRIDLLDPDIEFLSSPRIANYQSNVRETAGMTVSRFTKVNGVQVAVNAGFFNPQEYYLPEATPMVVSGLLISRGQLVSPANGSMYAAALMIDAANHASIVPTNWPPVSTTGVYTAISGDYPLLQGGVNIGRKYFNLGGAHDRNPRTAVGISENRRYLFLLTIDGRQPTYSEGAFDYETAAWLKLLGAHDGVNLDGGGSTTMVVEDSTGNPRRLNRPSAVADSGRERTVGGHLGVFAKPLRGFINDVAVIADDNAATITWTTTGAATSEVEYGLTAELELATPAQNAPVLNHAALLTDLQPDTGYYFRLVSMQGSIRYESATQFFTTTNYLSTNLVVALTDSWLYTAEDLDGINWTDPNYDDSAWSGPGAGLLWADTRSTGPNPEVQPRGAEMPSDVARGFPFPTYYFRRHFQLASKADGASLIFSGYIDDGAVIHLNGHEIHRLRMEDVPAPILNATLANTFPCSGNATCLDEFTVGSDLADYLVTGDNVIAVEVHNYNLGSADITFGLEVINAQPKTVPPLLTIAETGSTSTLRWTRGGFTLQHAESPQGPWSDVPGPVVSSPFVTENTSVSRYYRIRKQ